MHLSALPRSFRRASAQAAVLLFALSAGVAAAGPTCTDKPRSAWLDAAKFQAKLKAQGYAINTFKTTKGHCYEIYGKDKAGNKVEIYFDPVTGKAVKEERY